MPAWLPMPEVGRPITASTCGLAGLTAIFIIIIVLSIPRCCGQLRPPSVLINKPKCVPRYITPGFPPSATWCRWVFTFDSGRPATVGSVLFIRKLSTCHATKTGMTSNNNMPARTKPFGTLLIDCSRLLVTPGGEAGCFIDITLPLIFLRVGASYMR